MRGLFGTICAPSGLANAPQANTMAVTRRPGRRIARLLWLSRGPHWRPSPFGHENRYHKVSKWPRIPAEVRDLGNWWATGEPQMRMKLTDRAVARLPLPAAGREDV